MTVKGLIVSGGVAALVALGGGVTAAASTPAWHTVESLPSQRVGDFSAVVATGTTTAWAFDEYGTLAGAIPRAWERTGNTWTRVVFPGLANETVVAAGAGSPSDVWAFTDIGTGSRVLHWDGHRWSVVKTFSQMVSGASVDASNDIWVFGSYYSPQPLGYWHYDGRTWSHAAMNLNGGDALNARDVWAFSGTNIEHFNGGKWTSTSVKNLLPPRQALNFPAVMSVYAESDNNVYAIGNGNEQDQGGPLVLLHYNGRTWSKVAGGNYGSNLESSGQIASDGHGGLWISASGYQGLPSYILHYSAGKLIPATLPVGAQSITVESVVSIPGTGQALAGGFTHAPNAPATNVAAVILQYS